jgi:hypothetical protein
MTAGCISRDLSALNATADPVSPRGAPVEFPACGARPAMPVIAELIGFISNFLLAERLFCFECDVAGVG